MAIDLKKMREKLASLQNRGGGSSRSSFWRPQDGDQQIRIVPTSDGDPFKDRHFHYNLGSNAGFLCPKKNYGDRCPVCDFASALYKEGTEESMTMAKSLFPRQRFFSPVFVRGEEESGIRVWGYGKMAYESLLSLVLNPEYVDITDVMEGTDLKLTYGKPPGANFPVTKLVPSRKTSALCQDKTEEECHALLEGIPDFTTLFERKTTEDVQSLLDAYLSGDESAESRSNQTEKYNSSTPNNDKNVTPADSVETAFAELLGT